MGQKEELTDMISENGIKELKVGTVLKFEYEGSITSIKITKKDTKNMRIWGEHVELMPMDVGMSHYGHQIDRSKDVPFCTDCQLPVTDYATEEGESAAWGRDSKKMRKLRGGK